ncbi:MAG: hypothetical protein IKJ36_02235 [Clostridia bacterium]|nr:hypothetical protein [Clostridia bacterium]
MKNKKIFIALFVVLIVIILGITMYLIDINMMKNNKPVVFSTWGYDYAPPEINPEESNDFGIVKIKNGEINNETLIENFINSASIDSAEEQTLIIHEYTSEDKYVEKKLKFVPGTYSENVQKDGTTTLNTEDFEELYGYFVYTINNDETTAKIFNYKYLLKRNVEDGIVRLRFETSPYVFIEVVEFPIICSYSLGSSNYTNKFELNYQQRKDKELKTIIDKKENSEYEYSVHTLGGDVDFTIENDMVYTFEKALEEKVLTVEDILNQAKIDAKYGICYRGDYSDGGSTEFMYEDYTILKYSTLDGLKDLVIGYKGQIINEANKELNK